MLAVIDSNVFVSGLLGSPSCRKVFRLLSDGKFSLLISDTLFEELKAVINRPKFAVLIDAKEREDIIAFISRRAVFLKPKRSLSICRDIKDNKVLECASEGADVVVSGDNGLLTLETFEGVSILSPVEFLRIVKS